MLHAPDFLGYPDAIQMAKDHPEIVRRGLRLKKAGNEIVTLLGGREIHPINVRVGGFYKVPDVKELRALGEKYKAALDDVERMVVWSGQLPFPDFERDYNFVALRHPAEYPFNEGHIVSTSGVDVPVESYQTMFHEIHVKHSTALHSQIQGQGPYFVGPLARYNLNFDKLTPRAQAAAKTAGLGPVCKNPFQSIIVRLVETLYAYEEAIRIIDAYEKPDRPFVEIEPRACTGHGCTEAPRGILYHTYRMDDHGIIESARIVPPTSQNQPTIEEDLRQYVRDRVNLPDDKLQWQCEQAIRNYDPCISCSVHFLKLTVDRDG
jgi:coenzyme F420-reducing hydrogenase alpha subunit